MVHPALPQGPSSWGQSPDAAAIYNQYLSYYEDINAKIAAIDAKYPAGSEPPNVQQDRELLLALQDQLGPIYSKDYNDPNATLASFQADCSSIEASAAAAYADAMGGGSTIQEQIQEDYTNAQLIAAALQAAVGKDSSDLNDLIKEAASLESQIEQLQQQINSLPSGAQRTQAQNDLNTAQAVLQTLQGKISDTQTALKNVQQELANITGSGGILDQLKDLASLPDPTQGNLDEANALLGTVQTGQKDEGAVALSISAAKNLQATTETDIQTVQKDLNPTPPSGPIQNGCWYIDWTSWFTPPFNIPSGVNAINIFVGEITMVNGKYTMGGFGNMDPAALDAFIQQCHSQGIMVKVSIGGSGGQYDKCWDQLTPDNIALFAQGMVDFCHLHGLDGVDFDYEEFASSDQEKLVGTLIKEFKTLDPKLETSLCTNAGFGPNYPWTNAVKTILDAAMSNGTCMLDRLYIMSYYEDINQEEQWVTGWAQMLEQNYGFSPSRITVGIDDYDSHSYDPVAFAAWAEQQGFSTCHWAYDPAHPPISNLSPEETPLPPDETDTHRRRRNSLET